MMTIFTTTDIVNLTGGILELDEKQARRRLANLKKLEDGRFEIVKEVIFKAGETFGFDGLVPKAVLHAMADLDKVEVLQVEAVKPIKPVKDKK